MTSPGFNTSDPLALDHPGVAPWLESLARVSQALADAPDEARLYALISQAVLPTYGTICALYVRDSSGVPRPTLPPQPTAMAAPERLFTYEAQTDGATDAYARIALDGQAVMIPEVTPTWLEGLAHGPSHLALLQAIDLRSVVLAPLATRGKPTGLLLVGTTGHARPYTSSEVALIQLLATLAASTLAGHTIEQREVALQRRLDALNRAARELAHLVNNDLTLPVGTLELLLDRPEYSAELREMLAAAASDLAAAERHIRGFHELARGDRPPASGQGHPPPAPPAGPRPT
jgi:GAF domain-containing protein